ncbi:CYTH domain-containing protein [Paenibacillus rhizophilus]|uniref:CYTH domain-containing protein n=1 Tax=Paenibacillus rhizophilus TaxID=1850366 RepID=A0A3N9NXQ3_9BACL|nr:CYTH domain-containing protein [Paenibacillus rhizophilus]RQW08087.1 CYTH domain-containing protein [Paenibacillus rhizophilus]
MEMEIERKFLLPEFPQQLVQEGKLNIHSRQRIEQTYLAMDGPQELRVRKIENLASGEVHYTHTFKNGLGISREEIEYDISQGLYEQMIRAVRAVPLIKERITGEWNGVTVEIDIYDQLKLSVVEVEFHSLEEAQSFEAPEWFGQDVSEEKKYSNKTVWKELQKPVQ